jgi:PadR family transcriptional regulator PadR
MHKSVRASRAAAQKPLSSSIGILVAAIATEMSTGISESPPTERPGRGEANRDRCLRRDGSEDSPSQRHTRPSSGLTNAPVRSYANIIRNLMSKSNAEYESTAADRDLYSGLIRLHVLHHAVEGPVFGLGMIEELARHGYRISPGVLYPLLQGLEKKGYLRSTQKRNGKSLRRVYRATPLGRKALAASKSKVRELFHELIEGD